MRANSVASLDQVFARRAALEARIEASPALAKRLHRLRAWQAARLAATYEDLRADPRDAAAVNFLSNDLYGSQDDSRHRELRRAWRYFKRALPQGALEVLRRALTLDLLSAELDEALAEHLMAAPITKAAYAAAYRRVGNEQGRRCQIDLTVAIGEDLDRLVRSAWLRAMLRAARAPAHAAGFGALQDFLESGLSAFRQMRGARRLLDAIRERETHLMEALLEGGEAPARAPQR